MSISLARVWKPLAALTFLGTLATALIINVAASVVIISDVEQREASNTGHFAPRAASIPPTSTTGTITANGGAVVANANAYGAIAVQITGTWTGTIAWQISFDNGATWQNTTATPLGGGAAVANTTANGVWIVGVTGALQAQAVATAWSSGTANITLNPAPGIPSASTAVTVSSGPQTQSSFTLQSAAVANGNGTAAATSGLNGVQQLLIANGAGTCTVNVEGSFDNFATSQNVMLLGVTQLSSDTGGTGTTNTSRTSVASGAISVAANTSYAYTLNDYYPYVRARISAAAGLGAGASLTGCTVTLTALPQ